MTNNLEQGIPIPTPRRNQPTKYAFKGMEVSDSFLVQKTDDEPLERVRRRVYAAVSWANKQYKGKRFVTRTVDEGIRVWRTE